MFKKTVIPILLLVFQWAGCFSQPVVPDPDREFRAVYDATLEFMEVDPLIQNGIYYVYPYYNAEGHPFLGDKEFKTGTVIFRDKLYDGIGLNYDIFNQQVILSRKSGDVFQMTLLPENFVSGFSIENRLFRSESFDQQPTQYYQVVAETGTLSCYYSWYKNRLESRNSGDYMIFSFSDPKRRNYLILKGILYRYKNNRSFIKAFPEPARATIREYMKENRIQVGEVNDTLMNEVIRYCHTTLDKGQH